MALFLSVELGDQIRIGESLITIEQKTGRRIRLRIDSREDVDHKQGGDAAPARAPSSAESKPAVAQSPTHRLTRPSLVATDRRK